MATTVISTIGTGGDYTTAQAWEDASPVDLVAADEIWRGELIESVVWLQADVNWLTIGGSTTNIDCYKLLTAAPGLSFADSPDKLTNALRPDVANGILIEGINIKYGKVLVASNELYATLMGLQFVVSSGAKGTAVAGAGILDTLRVVNCIASSNGTQAVAVKLSASNSLFLFTGTGNNNELIYYGEGRGTLEYCTLAAVPPATASNGVTGNYGYPRQLRDCAIFGVANVFTGSGITVTNCFTDSAQSVAGLTQVAYDTSTGSGFENISSPATADYRIKATSALIDAGVALPLLPYDIVGTPRDAIPDVGCWEYSSSSGPVDHHTTGVVEGAGSNTTGSSTHAPTVVTHPTGGAVKGYQAAVTGTAKKFGIHTSTGVLLGNVGTVTGDARRDRLHTSVGALLGDFGTVEGDAALVTANPVHQTSGAVKGYQPTVTGAALKFGIHPTSGILTGQVGTVVGTARHIKKHATSGNVTGRSSTVIGTAARLDPLVDHGTFGEVDGPGAKTTGSAVNQGALTLTPADIAAIVAAITAAIVPVNIVQVNNLPVDGSGTESDPWGPS